MSTFSLYNNKIHTTVNGSKIRDHELTREKIVLETTDALHTKYSIKGNFDPLFGLNDICADVFDPLASSAFWTCFQRYS